VRTEDQIDAGAGPLDRLRLAVAALVTGCHGRLPLRAHVEQVDEEVFVSFSGCLVKTPCLTAGIGRRARQAADETVISGASSVMRPGPPNASSGS